MAGAEVPLSGVIDDIQGDEGQGRTGFFSKRIYDIYIRNH